MPKKSSTRINSLFYQITDKSKDKIIPQQDPVPHNVTETQDWQAVVVAYVKDDFRFIVSVALGLFILFAVFYVFPKVSSVTLLTLLCIAEFDTCQLSIVNH